MVNLEEELIDMMDLVDFTFSSDFVDKWGFKYGKRLPRIFQFRLMKSLSSHKFIKMTAIHKFLTTDSGFSSEVVNNFLKDIDYELYYPIIVGDLDEVM